MSATDANTPELPRVSIRLPRPLWMGFATAVLVVLAIGLGVAVPIYRQHLAIREIKRLGGLGVREMCDPTVIVPVPRAVPSPPSRSPGKIWE